MKKPGEGGPPINPPSRSSPILLQERIPLYPEPARRRQAKPRGPLVYPERLSRRAIHQSFAPPSFSQLHVLSCRARLEMVVTAEQFRRLALNFPEAHESSHMRHPDFRVRGGKLFATLAYPDTKWGMVKLTPEQQEEFVRAEPEAFEPVKGGWGRGGGPGGGFGAAPREALKQPMAPAWGEAAPAKFG